MAFSPVPPSVGRPIIAGFNIAVGNPPVRIKLARGGRLPRWNADDHNNGYDIYARAVIAVEFESDGFTRRTLFDFTERPGRWWRWRDRKLRRHIKKRNGRWVYKLRYNERVRLGCGFALDIPFPWCALIQARSGAADAGIEIKSGPVVDASFKREFTFVLNNGRPDRKPIYIGAGERWAQFILVQTAHFDPPSCEVPPETDFGDARGGGLGSSGRT